MRQQKKKNPNDPDADQINPDIIRIARNTGFMKQPMSLYLNGQLTWMECLETMVLLMAKEYQGQQNMLVDAMRERGPAVFLSIPITSKKLLKGLPVKPLQQPEFITHDATASIPVQ